MEYMANVDYKKLFDMTGKVCIVTGGTGYLGSGNVKALKDFGATVVVADVRPQEDRWGDAPVSAGDMFVECDLRSLDSVKNCFKTVYEKYGRIDVLVSCACYGVRGGATSFMEELEDEKFSEGVEGIIGSTFRCLREVVPYMKKTGGSIINYCSMYGLVAPDLRMYGDSYQRQGPSYGAGKAAVAQFTRYAAVDLAHYGIRVNSVTPGPFPNPHKQDDPEFNQKLADHTMLGRFGYNHEMAGAVLLLASDAGSFMTGTNITVDGGWTAW